MTGVAARLRGETRDLHDAIEAAVDWESRIATRAGYRDLLARWWGYHAAREPHLRNALGAVTIDQRIRVPALRSDLHALGMDQAAIAALPRCSAADVVITPAQALGALYVTEGATMGGQLIARGILARHGTNAPTAFYFPYGVRTGAMWATWRRELDRHDADADAILAEARHTFALLADWLRSPTA